MQNAEALVLRSVDFSESSLILTLFTKEFGKIEALAKGGRRLKSPFESALDILARIRVTFLQKRSDALDLLTEAKLVKRFSVSASNLAGLYAGYYVAELVNLLTERNDPSPTIFNLATKTLDQLETGTFVMRSLIRFEGLFFRAVGQQPSLDFCVECGTELVESGNPRERLAFGLLGGGVICPRCIRGVRDQGEERLVSVSAGAVGALRQLVDPGDTQRNWTRIPLNRNLLGEIRGLMNQYVVYQLGRKPRLYDWLAYISKNDQETA